MPTLTIAQPSSIKVHGSTPGDIRTGSQKVDLTSAELIIGCFQQALPSTALFTCLASSSHNTPRSAYAAHPHSSALDSSPATKRQVLFIGDSSVRLLYFAAVRLVDGGKGHVPPEWEAQAEKHSDRRVTMDDGVKSVDLEFWW